MDIPFIGSLNIWQTGWLLTGFFLILWIMKGHKKEKRYYLTEIPSKLVIEKDA